MIESRERERERLYRERKSLWKEEVRPGGEVKVKIIWLLYVHAPVSQDEGNYHVL